MPTAVVSVADARDRSLPSVSVKSGKPADGYAPVTVANRRIHLPLTQAEFDRVKDLQHRQRWAVYGGVGCVGFGVALARFPLIVPLALAIAILSLVLWVVLKLTLRAYLPGMTVDGTRVRMTRVHAGFVSALGQADS